DSVSPATSRALYSSVPVFLSHDPPPPLTHPLSLHDALPILHPLEALRGEGRIMHGRRQGVGHGIADHPGDAGGTVDHRPLPCLRSEEHTSELQSRENLVCRLLLEKKNKPLARHR